MTSCVTLLLTVSSRGPYSAMSSRTLLRSYPRLLSYRKADAVCPAVQPLRTSQPEQYWQDLHSRAEQRCAAARWSEKTLLGRGCLGGVCPHHMEPWSMHGASFFQMSSALRCNVLCTTCSSTRRQWPNTVQCPGPGCASSIVICTTSCMAPRKQHAPPNILGVVPCPPAGWGRSWTPW